MNQRFIIKIESFEQMPDIKGWVVQGLSRFRATALAFRHHRTRPVAEAARAGSHGASPPGAVFFICQDGSIRDLSVHMGRFGNRALVVVCFLPGPMQTHRRPGSTKRGAVPPHRREPDRVHRQVAALMVTWNVCQRQLLPHVRCALVGSRSGRASPPTPPQHREGVQRHMAMLTPANPEFTDEHVSFILDGWRPRMDQPWDSRRRWPSRRGSLDRSRRVGAQGG